MFQKKPCMVADNISKSMLCVAVHEYMKNAPASVHYWPSYEFVRCVGNHLSYPSLYEDETTRHENIEFVREIIGAFVERFFKR